MSIREKEIETDGVLRWLYNNYWKIITVDIIGGALGCIASLVLAFAGVWSWSFAEGMYKAFLTLFIFGLIFGLGD